MNILISILCAIMLLILALDYLAENWWSNNWLYDLWQSELFLTRAYQSLLQVVLSSFDIKFYQGD